MNARMIILQESGHPAPKTSKCNSGDGVAGVRLWDLDLVCFMSLRELMISYVLSLGLDGDISSSRSQVKN